ncbi:hypothetical protein [Halocola ammonii]
MKTLLKISLLLVFFSFESCLVYRGYVNVDNAFHVPTVNNNVCKRLKGKVIVYGIFVDSRQTGLWTEHDITSTIDSINYAMNWVEKQGQKAGAAVDIDFIYHQDDKGTIPIRGILSGQTLKGTLFDNGYRGGYATRKVDLWADKLARDAHRSLETDSSEITKTKIRPRGRDELLATLRDIHGTDNVALMYFLNNYYSDEVSVAIHTSEDEEPEYAVVSFKQPAIIAHEFLHLFGALDLYITPGMRKNKIKRKREFAMREFPNEVMAFYYRRLDTLNISPLTQYLVGWDNELSPEHKNMILSKKVEVAKYCVH